MQSRTQELLSQISGLSAGTYMFGTPDQRGDGFDIACAPHVDIAEQIKAAMPTGSVLHKIYANGFLCGYQVIVPEADEIIANCQHPGAWGPWYHLSVYRKAPTTKTGYVFVREIGNCGRGDARYPFGRPDRRSHAYAY